MPSKIFTSRLNFICIGLFCILGMYWHALFTGSVLCVHVNILSFSVRINFDTDINELHVKIVSFVVSTEYFRTIYTN